MKFLLTSAGISNTSIRDALVELLGKPISEASALCIPTGTYAMPGGAGAAWRVISGKASTPMCELGWKSLGVLELTALTEPGPFRPRTYELGEFWGIRENGHLAAMAGQRLALPGFIEISAVCTHPDFRGRRYSASLVSAMARAIDQRGQTPILHVLPTNAAAISVYESVGFVKRRSFDLTVVFPPSRSA